MLKSTVREKLCTIGDFLLITLFLLPFLYPRGEGFSPVVSVVEARDTVVGFPSVGKEGFLSFHGDFLKGFEAIGHKGRGYDGQMLDPLFAQSLEGGIGIGLQPRVAP